MSPNVALRNYILLTVEVILCIARNELERQFLEMLQFNINVPSGVYAKYYFDLRALAGDNDLSFPLEPLDKERAMKLEVRTVFKPGHENSITLTHGF